MNVARKQNLCFDNQMPENETSLLTIGIDCGVNGGVCWHHNGITTAMRMPPTDFDVVDLLASLSKRSPLVEMFIELPPLYAGRNIPSSAIGKLMMNYGICYGAGVALKFKIHPVRPQAWQKFHALGTKGDRTTTQWKNHLKAKASELYPDIAVTLWSADALLVLNAGLYSKQSL
jgi:hypothetical protein